MRRGRIRSSVRTEPRRTPPWLAGRSLQFLLVAMELAHDISANGPRCDLRSLRLLAFAVRLFVGRADEGAFNKHVSAPFRRCYNAGQKTTTRCHSAWPSVTSGQKTLSNSSDCGRRCRRMSATRVLTKCRILERETVTRAKEANQRSEV